MRRFQKVTLFMGLLLLGVITFWRELSLSNATHLLIWLLISAFGLSTAAGLLLALRSRSAQLPALDVAAYFFATVGFGFITMVAYNDLRANIPYPIRFAWFLSVLCVFFVVPWVLTEFRILHRSPLAFDAALPPFLACDLFQVAVPAYRFELFWDPYFWLLFGIPTILVTYFVMRRRVRLGKRTLAPLLASTAILYFILGIAYGSFVE